MRRAPAPQSCTVMSRDPETGKPARDVHLYREVVERIRASEVDVVINLTSGMGGDLVFGPLPTRRYRLIRKVPTWSLVPNGSHIWKPVCRKSRPSIAAR